VHTLLGEACNFVQQVSLLVLDGFVAFARTGVSSAATLVLLLLTALWFVIILNVIAAVPHFRHGWWLHGALSRVHECIQARLTL
jgi:hypothetical protein